MATARGFGTAIGVPGDSVVVSNGRRQSHKSSGAYAVAPSGAITISPVDCTPTIGVPAVPVVRSTGVTVCDEPVPMCTRWALACPG